MSPPDDDKAWGMLLSRLEGIETGVSTCNEKLDLHREQTRNDHLEVRQALKDLEEEQESTSSDLAQHLEDHGLVRDAQPSPDVAPTLMWMKHHPLRAIAALLCALSLAVPPLRAVLIANASSLLSLMGAL
jgi:hypothetical protein